MAPTGAIQRSQLKRVDDMVEVKTIAKAGIGGGILSNFATMFMPESNLRRVVGLAGTALLTLGGGYFLLEG